jgi:hypothetical protein
MEYIAYVRTASGAGQKIYVNGFEQALVSDNSYTFIDNADDKRIGVGTNGNDQFFSGMLDEVRLWNVARSSSDIQNWMNTTLQGNENGLVSYYRFDKGTPG